MRAAFHRLWLKPALAAAAGLLGAQAAPRVGFEAPDTSYAVELEKHEDLELLVRQNRFVLLDFYADWCGPCTTLTPLLENKVYKLHMAGRFEQAKLVKVNVDNHEHLCDFFRVGVE
jgi:thioredoxin-like negative regulator of GroEL